MKPSFRCGILPLFLSAIIFSGCQRSGSGQFCREGYFGYARYIDVHLLGDSLAAVVSFSPFDGMADTVDVRIPVRNVVCMSSGYAACLDALDCGSVISGVSGAGYITDPALRDRFFNAGPGKLPLYDVGYGPSLDQERLLILSPDLVASYTVSPADRRYMDRLSEAGIPVVYLYDHYEDHPLARAEYMRLFGLLAGKRKESDSLFNAVSQRYLSLSGDVRERIVGGADALSAEENKAPDIRKVLLNAPYGDAWYIPGEDNYFSQLVRDAGGEVLGARRGSRESSVITQEKAMLLARDADFWLNPGWCRTKSDILSSVPVSKYIDLDGIGIYNNIRITTPEGGNDFWESGAVRPDLILEDLVSIMHPDIADSIRTGSPDLVQPLQERLHYFIHVE